jgi:hypothetical protein
MHCYVLYNVDYRINISTLYNIVHCIMGGWLILMIAGIFWGFEYVTDDPGLGYSK